MLPIALLALAAPALVASASLQHGRPKHAIRQAPSPTSVALATPTTPWNSADRPDWSEQFDGTPWFKIADGTMQDHLRLHSYLSMSAYGDYKTECPPTFPKGYTVLEEFDAGGQAGYVVQVPDMMKITIVFRGTENYAAIDWSPYNIDSLVQGCKNCTVAKGIFDLYMSAKIATYDWKIAKDAVAKTGLLFSVTGHGDGGAVAALAALDLGARNFTHYFHQQGAPRAFNYNSVVACDNLYPVLAGQSIVARNDKIVDYIPLGDFSHLGQKVHLTGNLTQYMQVCWGNNENSTCLGDASSQSDHTYYFTPKGSCGAADKGF